MARKTTSVVLSPGTGSLDRHEQKAKEDMTTDALDVTNDDGDVRRRDAFAAFASGEPHYLPAGQTYIKSYRWSDQSFVDNLSRRPGSSSNVFGVSSGRYQVLVGCLSQFQGFDLARVEGNYPNADGVEQYIRVRFITSTFGTPTTIAGVRATHETAKWVGDTTVFINDSSADRRMPLTKNGKIWWHKDQQPPAWDTPVAVDGATGYWIIIDFADSPQNFDETPDNADAADWADGTAAQYLIVTSPGVRCFQLHPVTSIFPMFNRAEAQIITANTRRAHYGQEKGGPTLGALYNVKEGIQPIGLQKEYGSGILGDIGNYLERGRVSTGGTTDTSWPPNGAAASIYKNDTSYKWQQRTTESGGGLATLGSYGAPLLEADVTPLASPSPTTTSFTFTRANTRVNEFNNCHLLCTTTGGASITTNIPHRIINTAVSGTSVTITLDGIQPLGAAPNTSTRFRIFGPGNVWTSLERDLNDYNYAYRPYVEFFRNPGSDHLIQATALQGPAGTVTYDSVLPSTMSIDQSHISFQIAGQPVYELPENEFPDYAFDEVTREYLFAFGHYPLQRFNGKHMQEARATSDENDERVKDWVARISDRLAGDVEDAAYLKNSQLRFKAPAGKFVETLFNRIYVAGISGDPSRILYSAPGADNDIWPAGYETLVRDPTGAPITGLSTLNDELIAFTQNSIYASPPPDELGYMQMTPRSNGIGFINNKVVHKAVLSGAAVLLGANVDGIYAFTGSEPRIVLSEWDRLLENGVNEAAMVRACACVSYYENCYYIAVPEGASNVNNRIIRYDFKDGLWYVWTAPFGGVSAMAVDRDNNGNEVLMFGHEDGTISTLMPNGTDDGSTITGRMKSKPFSTGGTTVAVTGYMVTMEDLGDTNTVTINSYIDQNPVARQAWSGNFNAGTEDLGSFTLDTSTLGGRKLKTQKLNTKSGTRGTTIQLEVSGTSRWRLRSWEALISGKGQRSK